jgi:hypothetical protein
MQGNIGYYLTITLPGIDGEFRSSVKYSAKDVWFDYLLINDALKYKAVVKQRKGKFTRELTRNQLEKLAKEEME